MEPAGAEAPDVAAAPGGRLEVPDAAVARHGAVEALALRRRARDVAAAELRAAFSAAVEVSAPPEPASAPLVRVWIAPTVTQPRLAS